MFMFEIASHCSEAILAMTASFSARDLTEAVSARRGIPITRRGSPGTILGIAAPEYRLAMTRVCVRDSSTRPPTHKRYGRTGALARNDTTSVSARSLGYYSPGTILERFQDYARDCFVTLLRSVPRNDTCLCESLLRSKTRLQ